MSHLSILPTVLRDEDLLARALADLDLTVERGGDLVGFAGQRHPVVLRARLPEGQWLGWCRERDGSLALVSDLQRIGRSRSLQQLIGRITRRYAALQAIASAQSEFNQVKLELAL
ncbi:MAG: hypothetical protein RLZZ11_1540 [Cyanobacteriota bacterium]|jgi:hypothetical protein